MYNLNGSKPKVTKGRLRVVEGRNPKYELLKGELETKTVIGEKHEALKRPADPRFRKGFGQDTSEKVDHPTRRIATLTSVCKSGLLFRLENALPHNRQQEVIPVCCDHYCWRASSPTLIALAQYAVLAKYAHKSRNT